MREAAKVHGYRWERTFGDTRVFFRLFDPVTSISVWCVDESREAVAYERCMTTLRAMRAERGVVE